MKQNLITTLAIVLFFFCGLQAQTISLDPSSGFQDETLATTISGVGTQFQSGTSTCGTINWYNIAFHQGTEVIYPQYINVVDDSQIWVELAVPANASLGTYDVVILEDTPPGCEVSCGGCFEILDPGTITDLDVTSGGQGEELKVTISGENTFWSQGSPCAISASNVIFSQGSSTIFTPDNVVILDTDTICAFLTLPSDSIDVGFFDIVVGAGLGCETTCENCFEVMFGPEIVFFSSNQGGQGAQPVFNLGANNSSYADCELTTENVFLQFGSNIIYPTSVEIVDDELMASFDIPEDAAVGDYDLIVGDGLEYECMFSCEACYQVTAAPDIVLPTDIDGDQGGQATLSIGITNGTYADCELTTENVYLILGNNIIYPTSVEIVNDELVTTFDIPEDAAVGDYDLIVGEDLDYGCNFDCVACFTVNLTIGIDPVLNAVLSVYPNPFDSQIQLTSEMLLQDVNLQVFDAIGQVVLERSWSELQNEVLEVAHLPKGVYTIKVLAAEGEAYKRVVRQ